MGANFNFDMSDMQGLPGLPAPGAGIPGGAPAPQQFGAPPAGGYVDPQFPTGAPAGLGLQPAQSAGELNQFGMPNPVMNPSGYGAPQQFAPPAPQPGFDPGYQQVAPQPAPQQFVDPSQFGAPAPQQFAPPAQIPGVAPGFDPNQQFAAPQQTPQQAAAGADGKLNSKEAIALIKSSVDVGVIQSFLSDSRATVVEAAQKRLAALQNGGAQNAPAPTQQTAPQAYAQPQQQFEFVPEATQSVPAGAVTVDVTIRNCTPELLTRIYGVIG